jgi:hypothetical protein
MLNSLRIGIGSFQRKQYRVLHAQGEFICILNPDTVVAEDTFEKVLAFAKQKKLGIIGVKLIDGWGNFLPEVNAVCLCCITKWLVLYKIFPIKIIWTLYAQLRSRSVW